VGLLKKRPNIALRAPTQVRVGEPFEVEVVLDCEAEVECRGISVRHRGRMQLTEVQSQGAAQHWFYRALATLDVDGGVLPAGTHRRRVSLRIPRGAPPRYRGRAVEVAHLVDVRVDIPWWPDARAGFEIPVIEAHADEPDRAAWGGGVFGSRGDGGAGGKPYLELSVGSRLLIPGETFRAAISLFNTERHAYREVVVKLVAIERVSGRPYPRPAGVWTIPIAQAVEGATIPLRLQIPTHLVSAFRFGDGGVDWVLEASAQLLWGAPSVRMAVNVSRSHEPEASGLAEVGNVRLARVWNSVAEDLDLEARGTAMYGRVGEVEVLLERTDSVGVEATLRMPDLGLGLTRGGWRDRISARDPEHAEAAHERLRAAARGVGLTALDDRGATGEDPGAARNPGPLSGYATRALELATALDRLRHELPPPAALADQVPIWGALADDLGGQLDPGPMQVRGRRDGAAWSVAPRWDDEEVVALIVEARPDPAMEGRHHLRWRAADDPQPNSALALPAELWSGALGLEIDGDGIRVILSLPEAGQDLGRLVSPRLEALLGLCRARSSGGVYR
jgi:hypothetical protein